jgi:hypothetical protein
MGPSQAAGLGMTKHDGVEHGLRVDGQGNGTSQLPLVKRLAAQVQVEPDAPYIWSKSDFQSQYSSFALKR